MAPHVPRGFRFAADACGIRKDGRIDVALAVSDGPAIAAGVFTKNLVRAAPVELAAERIRSGKARAILVNSGCANACTGEPGMKAAIDSTRAVADALGFFGEEVLAASTGVIGALLPSDKIANGAPRLVDRLTTDGWDEFSKAILTTDRWPKVSSRALRTASGSSGASILGIAKGAGMIHPDLAPLHATMLAFLFTDAEVTALELERALVSATDRSFNAATVDGDTSTNDTVIALASGLAGAPAPGELERALGEVCRDLAISMVKDGEGANHVAEIRVRGLASDADARTVARTVATSLLVKTALFGRDANWGRLLAAAGRAGVAFDPKVARIEIDDVAIVEAGAPIGAEAEARANQVLARESYAVTLTLGSGPGSFDYWTCDLGHGYVDVNAGYRS